VRVADGNDEDEEAGDGRGEADEVLDGDTEDEKVLDDCVATTGGVILVDVAVEEQRKF
jgi:hypothetical protein